MNQLLTTQHLVPEVVQQLLAVSPDFVSATFHAKATELDCSVEAVIEMALASFLDEEAFSFEDCPLAKRLGQTS